FNREFSFNGIPWILCHLFDAQAHFAAVLIKRYNFSFMLVTELEEFLSIYRSVRPCDLTYVNKAFNTRHYFEECAVVFNIYHFTLHHLAFLDCFRKYVPRMRSQLFQAKADTF